LKSFLSTLATEANVIAISIDYRLAPEHQLPIAYDDSWAGLLWIAKHSNGNGPEPWINEYADLGRVILAGESAGGTGCGIGCHGYKKVTNSAPIFLG
jgi:A/G-specific adenine glycosylase